MACAGRTSATPPQWAVEIITRYAPIAVAQYSERRKTPYPTAEVERVCAENGFAPIAAPVG
jgi:hypothetical protein